MKRSTGVVCYAHATLERSRIKKKKRTTNGDEYMCVCVCVCVQGKGTRGRSDGGDRMNRMGAKGENVFTACLRGIADRTVGSWEGCRRALEEGTDRWQDNAFVRGYQTAAPSRGRAVRGRAGGAASRASRRHDGGRSDSKCPPPALHETKDTRRKRWLLDPGRRIIPCPAGSGPAAASSYYSSTGGKKQRPRPDSSVKVARVAREEEEEEEEERNGCAKHPQREKRQDGRRSIGLLTTSWRAQGRVAGHESAEGRMGGRAPAGVGERGPGDGGGGKDRERRADARERERVTGEEQRSDVETGGLASERLDGGKE
ncbi:hypothetical protein M432DRAFT_384801 [Thermoascus aurantiacus ATCC 26904]